MRGWSRNIKSFINKATGLMTVSALWLVRSSQILKAMPTPHLKQVRSHGRIANSLEVSFVLELMKKLQSCVCFLLFRRHVAGGLADFF